MDTYEHDPAIFTKVGAGDDKLLVVFHRHYMKNEEKSAAEGRPVYDDLDFIKILTPGDRDNIVHRPVRDPEDKLRFPRQWAAYQSGGGDRVDGTPLEHWPGVTRGQVEEFKFFHIQTVEQLAELKDDACQRMPGAVSLKARAQAYVAAAKNEAPLVEKQKQIDEQAAQIKALQEQVKELASMAKAPDGAKKVG
jgi:hypothetical protein